MELFTILTVQVPSTGGTVTATAVMTVDNGDVIRRQDVFLHLIEKVVAQGGPEFRNGVALFFSVEPNYVKVGGQL